MEAAVVTYTGFAPRLLMFKVQHLGASVAAALVTTVFFRYRLTPSLNSVMPSTVAVNAVAVDVESTEPNGIDAALLAVPPSLVLPAYFLLEIVVSV